MPSPTARTERFKENLEPQRSPETHYSFEHNTENGKQKESSRKEMKAGENLIFFSFHGCRENEAFNKSLFFLSVIDDVFYKAGFNELFPYDFRLYVFSLWDFVVLLVKVWFTLTLSLEVLGYRGT